MIMQPGKKPIFDRETIIHWNWGLICCFCETNPQATQWEGTILVSNKPFGLGSMISRDTMIENVHKSEGGILQPPNLGSALMGIIPKKESL